MFYNEIFDQTKVMRLPGESMAQRDWRSLYTMAEWYHHHLSAVSNNNNTTQIILLSEEFGQQDVPPDSGIVVYSMQQYLAIWFKDYALLQSLVQVLAEVVLEEDMDRIHMGGSNATASSSSTGYTEVNRNIKREKKGSRVCMCIVQKHGRIGSRDQVSQVLLRTYPMQI
jgi:DIS3-like exonuclease 1